MAVQQKQSCTHITHNRQLNIIVIAAKRTALDSCSGLRPQVSARIREVTSARYLAE